jgi:hypothetical protein
MVVATRGLADGCDTDAETFRQFGRDQLVASGEMADLRHRHLSWATTLVEGTRREAMTATVQLNARVFASPGVGVRDRPVRSGLRILAVAASAISTNGRAC